MTLLTVARISPVLWHRTGGGSLGSKIGRFAAAVVAVGGGAAAAGVVADAHSGLMAWEGSLQRHWYQLEASFWEPFQTSLTDHTHS